ncbi:MAG: hypothetical protein ACLFTK_09460 [Anaerolineales bacterium]
MTKQLMSLFIGLVLVVPIGVLAQSPEDDARATERLLTETYTDIDTAVRFDYPSGWATQATSLSSFLVVNEPPLLEDAFLRPLEPGEFLLEIALTTAGFYGFMTMELGVDYTMDELVGNVADGMQTAYAEEEAFTLGAPIALEIAEQTIGLVALEDKFGEGLVLVRALDDETFVILVGRAGGDDFDTYADVMLAMLLSVELEPSGFPG